MFNDSTQGISVLSYSLFNSVQDIIESNTFEQVTSDRVQFATDKGDIYFPLSTKVGFSSGSDRQKIPRFMLDEGSTNLKFMEFHDFKQNYISDDITTISYDKSLSIPSLLKQLAGDEKTYGVIMQHGSYMVNPLHPLVAFSFMTGLIEYPEFGELHIFEWSGSAMMDFDRMSDRKKKKEMKFYEDQYTEIFGLFPHLIKKPVTEKRTASLSNDDTTRLIESPLLEDINAKVRINVQTDSNTGDSTKSLLIPTQLAVTGIATPYYGLMFIQSPRDRIKGWNITPMMSGNLNQNMGESDTFDDLVNSTGSGNVCTGSESSTAPRGWETLSKINVNSMFSQNIVSATGLVPFVETSKKIAGTIWEDLEKTQLAAIDEATLEAFDG